MNYMYFSRYYLTRLTLVTTYVHGTIKVKVKASHTRYRALGPELIPVYRLSLIHI